MKFRQQEIEADIQETQHFIEQIDDDIAVGLKHAAKDAGVKIDVPAAIAPKKVNRLTPKASGPEIESVLMFIPLEKKHAVKISEIRAKVEFGRKVLEWIMLQLFKMGKIAKVGKSNQMRYYKKGRTLKQG